MCVRARGRDSRGADAIETYLTAVREVLAAPDFAKKVQAGARYRLAGETNCFNFTVDVEGRVYIVISSQDYPERLVFQMIGELVAKFKEYGPTSLTCPVNGLDKVSKRLLQDLAKQYDDPAKIDSLEGVRRDLNKVKGQMQTNLGSMLRNIDLAEDIDDNATQLKDQAAHFNTQATALHSREWWRAMRLYAAMFCLIAVIIVVVVLALFGPQLAGSGAATTATAPPALPPGSASGAPP